VVEFRVLIAGAVIVLDVALEPAEELRLAAKKVGDQLWGGGGVE